MSYRLVVDYGYGDKTWLERMLTPEDARRRLGEQIADDPDMFETVEEAYEYDHPIHSIEHDSWEDEEDWDWMDS